MTAQLRELHMRLDPGADRHMTRARRRELLKGMLDGAAETAGGVITDATAQATGAAAQAADASPTGGASAVRGDGKGAAPEAHGVTIQSPATLDTPADSQGDGRPLRNIDRLIQRFTRSRVGPNDSADSADSGRQRASRGYGLHYGRRAAIRRAGSRDSGGVTR